MVTTLRLLHAGADKKEILVALAPPSVIILKLCLHFIWLKQTFAKYSLHMCTHYIEMK